MIQIIGDSTTAEYRAALELRRLIIQANPDLENNHEQKVWIIAGAKCHGQEIRDIDLLLLIDFGKGIKYQTFLPFDFRGNTINNKEITVETLAIIIEVKNHTPESGMLRFEGSKVQVRYQNHFEWKDATEQNERQLYSVKGYSKSYGLESPYLVGLVWLRNVATLQIPDTARNVIGSDISWDGLLNVIGRNKPPYFDRTSGKWTQSAGSPDSVTRLADLFTKVVEPTSLDRRRMEQLVQTTSDVNQLLGKVGRQMLILKGGGGTGKTMRLLQLAYQLYRDQDARALILTYNLALVADIRRLLTFLGIPDDLIDHSIQVKTVHSFFNEALTALGIEKFDNTYNFSDEYERRKDEALSYFEAGLLGSVDLQKLRELGKDVFCWEYIFVDEGQDWPLNEQKLLFHLFPVSQIVIADGLDQLTRSQTHANWKDSVLGASSQIAITNYKTCLRMKSGLARFTIQLALELGLPIPDWEPNLAVAGGKVIILEGDYFKQKELHQQLLQQNQSQGNQPVDMLFCVSPRLAQVQPGFGISRSSVAQVFKDWGYDIWDGALISGRESYPTEVEQLRIVQYDSCRGLEGWTSVNLDLDGFYQHKLSLARDRLKLSSNSTEEIERKAQNEAARWTMIPLTRAMDTLIIQLSGQSPRLRTALRKTANICQDWVDWL